MVGEKRSKGRKGVKQKDDKSDWNRSEGKREEKGERAKRGLVIMK